MPLMNRRLVLVAAALPFLAAGCPSSSTVQHDSAPVLADKITGPRLRIAIVEFENKTTYGQRLGSASADILVTELAKTDRFILIERQKLEKIMQEQKLGMTGVVDPDTAAKVGRVLGAAAIVTGAVSEFGVKTEGSDALIAETKRQIAEAGVDVRIIDAETSQILYAESGHGKATNETGSFLGLGSHSSYDEGLEGKALRAAITGFANNLTSRLMQIPWSCRIADMDGPTMYLDAGLRSRLAVGTILEVVHLGAEIKSPATGLVIGRKEAVLGKARVTKSLGEDASQASMVEGNAPAKGDLCRIIVGENKGY